MFLSELGDLMKEVIRTSAITIVAVIGGTIFSQWAVSDLFTQSPEDKSKLLMKTASEVNANLPMNIDEDTVLFSTAGAQNKFTYNFRLLNYDKDNLDLAAFEEAMKPNITNSVCTTEDMKVFRDKEVIVSFGYFDTNQKQITVIDVDTKECQKT